MKYSLLICMCIFFIAPLTSFAQTITGENFVLTGPDGKMTAQLVTGGEGTPALFFYDTHWIPRITIWLYGDQVPGIVLNDEKGLATALLRMVNNQWDPVLVLKENGQDRLIIDKNGARQTESQSGFSFLLFWICWGFLGWVLSTYALSQVNKAKTTGSIT